ncbi:MULTISPECIES: hypothetical protein [unclassified Rhizobium]|uniref:hypothetical protein n=1 Tax=unclassified Rhizobium TaxID=2613769 RepID=UPI00161F5C8C|nr:MULTISPECIES: hypothetical protein [unclassified Rhizobium]MBB3320372.1 hypothetical protein [Rhizobium sp. BK181]MCS4096261.1 hypothetical protein [Rhizobium sp. BK176]
MSIDDFFSLGSPEPIRFTIFPQGCKSFDDRSWLPDRKKSAEKLSLASAIDRAGIVIDVDADLPAEEISECAVREVEDVARAHAKQFIDQLHFDRS